MCHCCSHRVVPIRRGDVAESAIAGLYAKESESRQGRGPSDSFRQSGASSGNRSEAVPETRAHHGRHHKVSWSWTNVKILKILLAIIAAKIVSKIVAKMSAKNK
jgi:hypothetical protein